MKVNKWEEREDKKRRGQDARRAVLEGGQEKSEAAFGQRNKIKKRGRRAAFGSFEHRERRAD
ncbi:hypothetical protein C1H46_012819 [Malus baccata]|uniref:Uncharacterized protein n=1 Tax=Malus baccata TaxID=106549 RepID=A0A540MS20_MALBA|nr:hypothetical protein C1H46_012819 [Malus baccata]